MIVTDPYLFTGTSEAGTAGGFENFLSYLDALPMPHREADFELLVPPHPKRGANARKGWERSVKKAFPNVRIASFRGGLHFHDRFYFAQHHRGELRGVFGPSLNGLGDSDIVLLGQIDDPHALKVFRDWFLR